MAQNFHADLPWNRTCITLWVFHCSLGLSGNNRCVYSTCDGGSSPGDVSLKVHSPTVCSSLTGQSSGLHGPDSGSSAWTASRTRGGYSDACSDEANAGCSWGASTANLEIYIKGGEKCYVNLATRINFYLDRLNKWQHQIIPCQFL